MERPTAAAEAARDDVPPVGEWRMQAPSERYAAPTYVGTVYPRDVDHMGHANVASYTTMFDSATWVFFDRHGLGRTYFEASGCGMAALSQTTTYGRELFAGDTVVIRTDVLEVREKTIRFRHTLCLSSSGDLVATSELLGAHLDRGRHRAVPFPPQIADSLRRHLVTDRG